MDTEKMVDELVSLLDNGVVNGVGHVNVDNDPAEESLMTMNTMGCTDCSRTPLACSVPTLHQGLDDYH